MADNKVHDIIQIEDEREDNSLRKDLHPPPDTKKHLFQPTNFNPHTFPSLTQMLKKFSAIPHKSGPTPPPPLPESVKPPPTETMSMIVPLRQSTPEIQVKQVTRYQPGSVKLITVVEDTKGIPLSELVDYFPQTRIQTEKPNKEIFVQVEDNSQALASAIQKIILSDEKCLALLQNQQQRNQIIVSQTQDNAQIHQVTNLQNQTPAQNQLSANFVQIQTLNNEINNEVSLESKQLPQNSIQLQISYKEMVDQKIALNPISQNSISNNIQIHNGSVACSQQNRPIDEISYQSMEVQKPSSDAQDSIFLLQPSIVEVVPDQNYFTKTKSVQMDIIIQNEISKDDYDHPNSEPIYNEQYSHSHTVHNIPEEIEDISSIQRNKLIQYRPQISEISGADNAISQQPAVSPVFSPPSNHQSFNKEPIINGPQLEVQIPPQPIKQTQQSVIVPQQIKVPEVSLPNIQTQNKQTHLDNSGQHQQSNFYSMVSLNSIQSQKMATNQQINVIKQRIACLLPDFAQKIHDITNEQVWQIYLMIKKQMKMDLRLSPPQNSYQMPQDISKQNDGNVPAQTTQIAHSQKYKTLDIQPESINKQITMNTNQNQQPSTNSQPDPLRKLQKLKELSEEELRARIEEYFPQSKEILVGMSFTDLQKMVHDAFEELSKKQAIRRRRILQQNLNAGEVMAVESDHAATIIQQQLTNGVAHNPLPQKQTESIKQIAPALNASQMRASILTKVPELTQQVTQITDKHIANIYTTHFQPSSGSTSIKQIKPPNFDNPAASEPQKLTIQQIIDYCVKKYPELKQDIYKLNEQSIRQIYENVVMKFGPGFITTPKPKQASPKQTSSEKKAPQSSYTNREKQTADKPQDTTQKETHPVQKGQANLKRSHQTMMATNSKKTEEVKQVQAKDKKKKLSSNQIRNILISKLPQLKNNIMMLDDIQIQRIFYESIQNGKNQIAISQTASKPQTKLNDPPKPVVVLTDKKIINEAPNIKNTQIVLPQSKQNIQIVESFDQNRKKKMRTVILVHSQIDCSDKDTETFSKGIRVEGGIHRKCTCDCCKKLNVTELLSRLGELLDEKK